MTTRPAAARRQPGRRDAATTSERIRRTALELFASKGFEATGIRELADGVGMTTASLYHYVGTKAELLTYIMRDAHGRLLTAATGALEDIESPPARLARLVHVHVMVHALFQLEAKTVDTELRALERTALREILAARHRYEQLWRDAIQDGADSGEFDVADLSTARLALMSMCTGVAHWFSPSGKQTPSALASTLSDLALSMLRATGPDGKPLNTTDLRLADPDTLIPLFDGEATVLGSRRSGRKENP
jgi:AcrR family transcriptional regulator